jgi:EAL domain-containing protein (putative c-di-GMP-specific phosphodiesterase class I)
MRELDSAMADRIKQGIVDDEFVVHYQPIVGLDDGHLVTVEALVRWEHPERGTLPPAAFLDAAERSGAIVDLGDFVIDRACREAAAWRRSGADIRLSVNVSTRQLADERLAGRFTDILRASEFDPACLWLEVTETAIVEELDRAARALHALVALGVGVSIDDFGTGWASLTYLKNFPVHALKIDGSFVAGVGHDGYATAIVRSILSLGAELDLFVVAEGIETQEQHDRLKAMGCTLGQGYLYGRPSPADDVAIERARRIPDRVATGVPAHQHYS